jgi:hypothetical protein
VLGDEGGVIDPEGIARVDESTTVIRQRRLERQPGVSAESPDSRVSSSGKESHDALKDTKVDTVDDIRQARYSLSHM